MLTIGQVRDDLLSKLATSVALGADSGAYQDCVIAINGALQVLQTAGQDFFTRQKQTVAFGAGTAFLPLAQSVQNIIGPARWNGIPLRALTSRGELDQFDRIFLGSSTYGAAQGVPMAYWVESLGGQSGADPDLINLYLTPVPAAPGSLVVEFVNVAPAYVVADLTAGTALIPVAQGYIESVFLPIARMMVTLSSEFSRPDIVPQLKADSDRAMATLANVGGFPNTIKAAPPREVEA